MVAVHHRRSTTSRITRESNPSTSTGSPSKRLAGDNKYRLSSRHTRTPQLMRPPTASVTFIPCFSKALPVVDESTKMRSTTTAVKGDGRRQRRPRTEPLNRLVCWLSLAENRFTDIIINNGKLITLYIGSRDARRMYRDPNLVMP